MCKMCIFIIYISLKLKINVYICYSFFYIFFYLFVKIKICVKKVFTSIRVFENFLSILLKKYIFFRK